MPANFPTNPSIGDTYTLDDRSWTWDGTAWNVTVAPATVVQIRDSDNDTRIHTEETADDDTLRFDTAGVERATISADGTVTVFGSTVLGGGASVGGHLIPDTNETYDLGAPSARFRDLYLSGTTIDLGGMRLSSDGSSLSMTPSGGAPADPLATESFVSTAVSNLVDSAPAALNTLNELAAALGDDANYASTVTTALAGKLDKSGGSITSDLTVDTDTFHVDSANNRVGIGTTTPSYKLDVAGDIHISNSGPFLIFTDTDTNAESRISANSSFGSLIIDADYNNEQAGTNIVFTSDGAEKMRIDSSGNVGIGDTSPSYKLDVNGSLRAATGQFGGSSGDAITIGNDSKLVDVNIANTIGLYGVQDSTVASIKLGSGGGSISGASSRVGINDTTPSYTLDVNGDIRSTGSVYLTGMGSVPIGEWQSYTPGIVNSTLGNGTTVGYYMRVGNIIHAYASFTLGTTSSWDNRYGRITTPVAAKHSAWNDTLSNAHIIQVEVRDSTAGRTYIMGGYIYDSGTRFRINGWRSIDATAGSGIQDGYFIDLSNDVVLGDGDSIVITAIYMADD